MRKQNPAKIFMITRKRKNFPPIGTKSTALPIGWEKLCFAAVIRFFLLASPNNPLRAESFLSPPQLTGQTVCFESRDAVFVSIVRRCMEEMPMRWLMVPSFEKEYVRMLAGKCLFFSPVRGHGSPREWFHALMFPFPPMPWRTAGCKW